MTYTFLNSGLFYDHRLSPRARHPLWSLWRGLLIRHTQSTELQGILQVKVQVFHLQWYWKDRVLLQVFKCKVLHSTGHSVGSNQLHVSWVWNKRVTSLAEGCFGCLGLSWTLIAGFRGVWLCRKWHRCSGFCAQSSGGREKTIHCSPPPYSSCAWLKLSKLLFSLYHCQFHLQYPVVT